jgi:arsenate reductase
MVVYGINNCDTVKKARRWLEANDVAYQFHDVRKDGLDKDTIEQWLKMVDWQTLLNKRGTTWRKLEDPRKDNVDKATAVELMLTHPTLIKRPVIHAEDHCVVGFNDSTYTELFGN